MEQSQAAPIPPSERIVTLDVLRAFALLGILVMNMPFFFASGWSALPPHERWPGTYDRATWWVMGSSTPCSPFSSVLDSPSNWNGCSPGRRVH
jgi:uncharacterized membrane protein YeiB